MRKTHAKQVRVERSGIPFSNPLLALGIPVVISVLYRSLLYKRRTFIDHNLQRSTYTMYSTLSLVDSYCSPNGLLLKARIEMDNLISTYTINLVTTLLEKV